MTESVFATIRRLNRKKERERPVYFRTRHYRRYFRQFPDENPTLLGRPVFLTKRFGLVTKTRRLDRGKGWDYRTLTSIERESISLGRWVGWERWP